LDENSADGVITSFCGACTKKLLQHKELGIFWVVKIFLLHSYYYIGENRGFFSSLEIALTRRALHWEWWFQGYSRWRGIVGEDAVESCDRSRWEKLCTFSCPAPRRRHDGPRHTHRSCI